MAKPTAQSVHNAATALDVRLSAQAQLIEQLTEQFGTYKTSMAAELEQVKLTHSNELVEIKDVYDRKIASLEEKLIIVINTDANATLRTVTGFFQTHDKRMTELACSIDVNDERSSKNAANIRSIIDDGDNFRNGKIGAHVINDMNDDFVAGQESTLTLKSLEERIDGLEDYSRRDNLLFYGFQEEKFEDCKAKVVNFIYKKTDTGYRIRRKYRICTHS